MTENNNSVYTELNRAEVKRMIPQNPRTNMPLIHTHTTVQSMMRDCIIALLPALAWGFYRYGIRAIIITAISILSFVASEFVFQKIMRLPVTIHDGSAALSGLILAMTLPADAPFWMPVLAAVFAMAVIKGFSGGLGKNFVNPALAARLLLELFPAARIKENVLINLTAGTHPNGTYAGTGLFDMFIGRYSGGNAAIGTASVLMLLLGAIYLAYRGVIRLQGFALYIGAAFAVSLFWPNVQIGTLEFALGNVMCGYVVFGALILAQDPVTAPIGNVSRNVFCAIIGALTIFLRMRFSTADRVIDGTMISIIALDIIVAIWDRLVIFRSFVAGAIRSYVMRISRKSSDRYESAAAAALAKAEKKEIEERAKIVRRIKKTGSKIKVDDKADTAVFDVIRETPKQSKAEKARAKAEEKRLKRKGKENISDLFEDEAKKAKEAEERLEREKKISEQEELLRAEEEVKHAILEEERKAAERARAEAKAQRKEEMRLSIEQRSKERADGVKAEAEMLAKRAVEKQKIKLEAKARAEEKMKLRAEAKAAKLKRARDAEEEKIRLKREAEAKAKAAEEAKIMAQEQAKAAEYAKIRAEEMARAKAEAEEIAKAKENERREAEERIAAAQKAKEEAERRIAEEEKAREEAERRAEAEAKARADALAKAEKIELERLEAEQKARDAEKARLEAKARADEIERARMEAEEKASAIEREKAEALAKAEKVNEELRAAEEKARKEAEAKAEAEQKAKEDARIRAEAEERAKAEKEARIIAEEKARIAAEERAIAEAKAEEERRLLAEQEAQRKLEREAEQKAKDRELEKAQIIADARAKAEEKIRLAEEKKQRQKELEAAKAEAKAKAKADEKLRRETDARVKAEAKAEQKARRIAEEERIRKEEAEKRIKAEREAAEKREAERQKRENKEMMRSTFDDNAITGIIEGLKQKIATSQGMTDDVDESVIFDDPMQKVDPKKAKMISSLRSKNKARQKRVNKKFDGE